MLHKTAIEYLGIIMITAGLLLSAMGMSLVTLVIGASLFIAGIVLIYLHYLQMGTEPDIFG